MRDDSIGVRVTEVLKEWMEEQGMEVVVGETDVENCFNQISDEDFLVVIDATLYDLVPGTITQQELTQVNPSPKVYSQHDLGLIELLSRYEKKNKGYFIGIEAGEIGFGIDLSKELALKFDGIVMKVKKLIEDILEEYKDA